MAPPPTPSVADRTRLSLDLAPAVALLLDHVSTVTGVPRSQVALQALLDALPVLLERADAMAKRQTALVQAARQGAKR